MEKNQQRNRVGQPPFKENPKLSVLPHFRLTFSHFGETLRLESYIVGISEKVRHPRDPQNIVGTHHPHYLHKVGIRLCTHHPPWTTIVGLHWVCC